MCRHNRLDQRTWCVVSTAWRLCAVRTLFVYAFFFFFFFCSCSIIKKSKPRRETVAEMSVTALRRQQLPWRKHATEPVCQRGGWTTGDVHFREDDSHCPEAGLVRRCRHKWDPLSQRCDITWTSQRDGFKLRFMRSHKYFPTELMRFSRV